MFWLQDLWIVNSAVVLLYSVLANPSTFLYTILSGTSHISVLDFKDAFFSIPLNTQSNHFSLYLDCPILGIQDSPHQFDQVLASGLLSFSLPTSKLIQYVNDLLPLHSVTTISQTDTSALLNFLSSQGPRVSTSKVQLFTFRLPR